MKITDLITALNESTRAPDLTDEAVRAFGSEVQQRLGLAQFDVYLSNQGDIVLNILIVPKEMQKRGLGTQAMEALCGFADRHGRRILLTPGLKDDRHGTTSRARLVRYYKRFGFRENTGRSKDFSISHGMIRPPNNKF